MLSIIYYIYLVIICTFWLIISALLLLVTYPFDKSRKAVHWCSRVLTRMYYKTPFTWRQHIVGLENIDRRARYVIVVNHNSMNDILSLYFLPLGFRWVSKREAMRIPYIGLYLLLHGDILIERGNAATAMRTVLDEGKLWLGRGVSVAMFPEGTRSRDGEIHRFKAGAFTLAQEAGVAILPVVMDGTTEVIKKNKMVNWRYRFSMTVLPPVPAEQVATADTAELSARVQAQMTDALAAMREYKRNNK